MQTNFKERSEDPIGDGLAVRKWSTLSDSEVTEPDWPSIEDCIPDEQGGPVARSGFAYQDYIAATLVFDMLEDTEIEQVHCETIDDVVVVRANTNGSPRIVEYVQVKTTKKDSLWSCSRLCGTANDEPGTSVFEKSLSRDRTQEQSLFRLVTLQGVSSKLRPLTYPIDHQSRNLSNEDMIVLKTDIDARCPEAASPKGATAADWLSRVLWVEGAELSSLRDTLIRRIATFSLSDGSQGLFADQAERVLESLLAWVRKAGDARFVPDKEKKIIRSNQFHDWWQAQLDKERNGLLVPSGGKLRQKMSADVASSDMLESALQLRRQYSEERRSPKYLQPSDVEKISINVQSTLMALRTRRFTGQNTESASLFHLSCQNAARAAADRSGGHNGISEAMALGCLYEIVDRCQLTFSGSAQ